MDKKDIPQFILPYIYPNEQLKEYHKIDMSHLIITSHRILMVKRGIFSHEIKEVPINSVQFLKYEETSKSQKLLGIGSFILGIIFLVITGIFYGIDFRFTWPFIIIPIVFFVISYYTFSSGAMVMGFGNEAVKITGDKRKLERFRVSIKMHRVGLSYYEEENKRMSIVNKSEAMSSKTADFVSCTECNENNLFLSRFCAFCGVEMEDLQKCCKLYGRMGDAYCNDCGRVIPEDWIVTNN